VTEILLEHGADVHVLDYQNGTPLKAQVNLGAGVDSWTMLLNAGANPSAMLTAFY
jgi:hypothetical protein